MYSSSNNPTYVIYILIFEVIGQKSSTTNVKAQNGNSQAAGQMTSSTAFDTISIKLNGGEGGIRTHGPLRSHWFSRPAP